MKLDFRKNTKRNAIAAAINRAIGILFPFFNRTLFLWLLGPSYLGLNGLFGSILGVLMLAELGFGQAVVCSMYKSVAEDDNELLCAYLHFYRKVYRCVGTIILVAGLMLMPFLRQLIHGNIPPDLNLHVLYLIHLLNTSCSYFFFAYRGSILSAYHRRDVLNNIRTICSILQYITVFLILFITRNYYYYVIAMVVFTLLSNILTVIASKRLFPKIIPQGKLPESIRKRVISDVKDIFMHKVGAAITTSIDNIVISKFLGLVAVAIYGNYYYVIQHVGTIPNIISDSVLGGFGNKIYTVDKEENFQLFMRMNQIINIAIVWCAAITSALYQPFILLWSKNNQNLTLHIFLPILMVIFFYIHQTRQILLSFKSAAALWHQDRWKPIVAGALNLTLNITFVKTFPEGYKLEGVILSTIISFIIVQIPWESHVVFTNFFNAQQARKYWRLQLKFAILAAFMCGITLTATFFIPVKGLPGLLVKAAVATIITTTILFAIFHNEIADTLKTRKKTA